MEEGVPALGFGKDISNTQHWTAENGSDVFVIHIHILEEDSV
jgi:hypothetical protein